MKTKNLKFRIKRVIVLSILFSIMSFTLVLSLTSYKSEKDQAYLLASMISNLASKEIFSTEVLEYLHLESFRNINTEYVYSRMIVARINEFENKLLRSLIDNNQVGKSYMMLSGEGIPSNLESFQLKDNHITNGDFRMGEIIQMRVTIYGRKIFESPYWGNSMYLTNYKGKPIYPFIQFMSDRFNVVAEYHVADSGDESIPDIEGKPFATVAVRLDPGFMVSQYNTVLYGIIISAMAALIISFFIAHLLSKSISSPLSMMVSKLRSLALEDYETTLHSQILVKKRALKEIKSIAGSTNTIISKMHQYNIMQLNQTGQLEKLKFELETQKEELLESRHTIQEAQTQLVQSQNLASIGQLTAAISHEINQPLENIRMGVENQNNSVERLLQHEKVRNNEEILSLIGQLQEAGTLNFTAFSRISSIIKSLENFSRLDQTEMEMACINENVKSVVLLTSNLWKRRINMHEDYGDLPFVYCYPGLINQVFMNIVVNAIHAIPEKGDIYIKTSSDNDFAYISIKDTGTGIAENILPFIFETGFTTKKSGKGSGLGLSICRDIVKKHHGKIEVESKEGEGTEFTIILPLKRAA